MPIFTAIAVGLTAVLGVTITAAAVATFAMQMVAMIVISQIMARRASANAAQQDAGARIQLPPATNNKLPIVYGRAFISGCVTDAKISEDQTTMWYVLALADCTSGAYSFGDIYYGGKKITFDLGDPSKVVSLTTNDIAQTVDTKVNGHMRLWLFTNGSSSGVNTAGQTAIQILNDSRIPVDQRVAATYLMSNTAFMILSLDYNSDAGTTGLGTLNVQVINTLKEPGSCIQDYMLNNRYGCNLPIEAIDTDSIIALDAYSNALITYTPEGGGSATQNRYEFNGPVNTGNDCLSNLQLMVDCCDSWLQFSELTAQWKIVLNQSYLDYTTFNDLYHVNSDNLVGGITVNPTDLNSTFNSMEVGYPNKHMKDQVDFVIVALADTFPALLNPNEPDNRINIQYGLITNSVTAQYLGLRRLLQAREDLAITCSLDYSGIQVAAGDVIKVTLDVYGWVEKLFRVIQVMEAKDDNGFLGVRLVATEYNDTVYDDQLLLEFIPESNTGLTNVSSSLGTPIAPIVAMSPLTAGNVKAFTVTATVPAGLVIRMDYYYGNTDDITTHLMYTTTSTGTGLPFVTGTTPYISVVDMDPQNLYWSIKAVNDTAARHGPASMLFVWDGPGVTEFDPDGAGPGVPAGGVESKHIADGAVTTNKYYDLSIDASKIMDGVISAAKMAPGVLGSQVTQLNRYIYFIPYPNGTIVPPIDLTTYSTAYKAEDFVKAKYLTGTTVTGTDTFPYFYGTSTTTKGYAANSTAPWYPMGASQLVIDNGHDNWWLLEYMPLPGGATAVTVQATKTIMLVADANTTIQIAGVITTTANNKMNINGDTFNTIELKAGKSVEVRHIGGATTGGASIMDGVGTVIRNMVSGTTVTVMTCEFILTSVT